MSRLIINNDSSLPDEEVLLYVRDVVMNGRVSNDGKQYCYLTVFNGGKLYISTELRKKSDSFRVWEEV